MRALLGSAPAVLLAGTASTLGFAPFGWWLLQPLTLALLVHAASGATVRRAGWLGWLYGVGWLTSGLWWLYISMHDYGGMAAPLAATAVVALAALLALYYALSLAAWARWRSGGPGAGAAVADTALLAALWLLAELGRATLFTGFPWVASGYAHAAGPLAAAAPWIGVYGLCALGAWCAAALVAAVRPAGHATWRARTAPVLIAVGLVGAAQLLPSDFTHDAGSLRVSLLQPNVAQDLKFDPQRLGENLEGLLADVQAATGQVVVTPESVVPLSRRELHDDYWAALQQATVGRGRALLLGIFTGDEQAGFVNSVVGLAPPQGVAVDAAPADYRYGKRHLLPFGEFVPPGFRWFVDLMAIPLGDQARGQSSAPFVVGGQRLRPLVCYEDLFGEDIVSSVVGPGAATVFVNVSNLAWFGRWMIQDQHLQFSQMRALEFQRPVVRSTNTGATALVDHHGRVAARLAPHTRGVLEVQVQGRLGETPYARWLSRTGLWPLFALALAVVLAAARAAAARRGRAGQGGWGAP